MGRFIVKLDRYYMEWSTITDSPRTYGMSCKEFEDYYRQQYGESAMKEFEERMARVKEKGTSALQYKSAEEVIAYNRAGPNESCLTKEQIIEEYCRVH